MSETPQTSSGPDRGGLVIAALLALLAVVLAWDSTKITSNTVYGMGPEVMPRVIAIGLGILAVANLVDALRGNLPARESADPIAVWLILGGLALMIATIALGGGFIIATSILFVATSAAFGRRAFVVDALIAIVLTTSVYLVFDKLLTLSLPAGPLERLL